MALIVQQQEIVTIRQVKHRRSSTPSHDQGAEASSMTAAEDGQQPLMLFPSKEGYMRFRPVPNSFLLIPQLPPRFTVRMLPCIIWIIQTSSAGA